MSVLKSSFERIVNVFWGSPAHGRKETPRHRRLVFESLENRVLLSGAPFFGFAGIEGGAYTSYNTNPASLPTIISDTAYVFQAPTNDKAEVRADIDGYVPEWGSYEWSIEILDPGDYWHRTTISSNIFGMSDSVYDGAPFTWSKPAGLENNDADIDRDFTFRFTVGTQYLDLDVHIAWAEVKVQFAGEGDYKHTTTVGGQNANNTVVIGQKVHAIVDIDPVMTTNYINWASPSGGSFVKNYTTTYGIETIDSIEIVDGTEIVVSKEIVVSAGTVVNHTTSDRHSEEFEFYYISKSTNTANIGISLILINPNGTFHNLTREATYYLEKPTVTSFSSEFASWPGTDELPTGVRPFVTGGDRLILGGTPAGQQFSPGIEWTANVTAPTFGGGQIAYNQMVNGSYQRYVTGDPNPREKTGTNGVTMLDTTFPYENIVPVGTTLIDNDSPGILLENMSSTDPFPLPLYKYTANLSFNTYLIYKPDGNDTIWVTLSVIDWEWNATAEYNDTTFEWEATSYYTTSGGVGGTATSYLPQWTDSVANYEPWIPIN